jgi:hypothetical protein
MFILIYLCVYCSVREVTVKEVLHIFKALCLVRYYFAYRTVSSVLAEITQSVYPLGYGLDDRGFPVGASSISLLHNVHTSSEAHLASYAMGTGSCFPGDKAAGAEVELSPNLVLRLRMVELYLHSPYVFIPWCLIN